MTEPHTGSNNEAGRELPCRPRVPTEDIALQMGVSQRTIQRIALEPAVDETDDRRARRARQVGRPPVPDSLPQQLRSLIAEDPEAPPREVLRQLREERVRLGESTSITSTAPRRRRCPRR